MCGLYKEIRKIQFHFGTHVYTINQFPCMGRLLGKEIHIKFNKPIITKSSFYFVFIILVINEKYLITYFSAIIFKQILKFQICVFFFFFKWLLLSNSFLFLNTCSLE